MEQTPEVGGHSKKIVLILNGLSAKKKFFYSGILPSLHAFSSIEVRETKSEFDASALASRAVADGVDAILAAGGDGTLHQVVNGVLNGNENRNDLPAIGLVPLGSANDFARTLNLISNPESVQQILQLFKPKPVDVGKLHFKAQSNIRYFVNIADTGMGPEVADRINKGSKRFGSGLAYYGAILKTFMTYSPCGVHIKTEAWNWSGKIRTLAIANGKCFGHGLTIAPDARVDDGVFSVFIAEDVSVLEFIRYSGQLKKGIRIEHPKIHYRQAREIEVSSIADLGVEADGELLGKLPVRIEVLPKRLDFLY